MAGLITEAEYSFHIDLPENIYTLFRVFKKHGKKLFVVGGAVRDALLNKQPKDFDVVTDALPDEVEEILNSEKIYNFPSGKNFGIISAVINDETFEIATFRTESFINYELDDFKKYLKSLNNGKYEEFIIKLMK
ncbi:MAG TPA: hypothetical protein PLC61_10280 [Chitinophagales bacterium]|nr:hypothetical protein [Chitinophagales bacterium]